MRKAINKCRRNYKNRKSVFYSQHSTNWFRQEPHLDAWMKKALGERFGGKDVQSLKDHLITKVEGCFTMEEVSRNYHNQVTGLGVTSNHKS